MHNGGRLSIFLNMGGAVPPYKTRKENEVAHMGRAQMGSGPIEPYKKHTANVKEHQQQNTHICLTYRDDGRTV